MTTSALGQRAFTFATFHAFTADLLGHEKAAVFTQLSPRLQVEAWRDLAERTQGRTDAMFKAMGGEC
jgi:hypothetical protein